MKRQSLHHPRYVFVSTSGSQTDAMELVMITEPRVPQARVTMKSGAGQACTRRGLRVPLVLLMFAASAGLAIATPADGLPPADPAATAGASGEARSPLAYEYIPYGEWAVGEAPTSTPEELDEIFRPKEATVDVPVLDGPIDRFIAATSSFEERTGLRIGFAYTTIFQQASGGPGTRRGFSGDLDIMAAWTLLGRGTANTGQLIFSVEERHNIGPNPASVLRGEIGTLHPITNGFNDRGFVVRDFYWVHRLWDGKFGYALGRGDTSDFFGAHRMQSLNNSFSNRAFSANTTIPSPGHGMFAGISLRPVQDFYGTIGVANAYASTTINDMKYLEEGSFFSFGEFGYTPNIEGLGSGRYRVVLWNIDDRERRAPAPSDNGISIIVDQDLGEHFLVFARYGYADRGRVTGIRQSVETGMGVRGLLGSPDNMTGLAFAYSVPQDSDARDEKIVECFHRWQLTRHTQFSVGVQGIFDPSNADPENDSVAVFTTRLRIAF